jgi:hypothetical protein
LHRTASPSSRASKSCAQCRCTCSAGGIPVEGFEVQLARPSERLLVYDQREGSSLPSGVWAARDRAAHELLMFHREFLPSEPVRVPAAQSERDAALIVDLVRGTKVRFLVPRKAVPTTTSPSGSTTAASRAST